MTNLLSETFQSRLRGQGDEVVSDRQNRPVCLDACPGAHKHFPKAQMLFDVLVKGFDRKTLGVNPRHFGFRHVELVGDKETMLASETGDKKFDSPHLRKPDDLGSDPVLFFLGDSHPFVTHPPLGQKMDGDFHSVEENVTVLFQGRDKSPTRLLDRIENRSAGIPGVHDDRKPSWEKAKGLFQDLQSQIDFAFESLRRANFFGPIAAKGEDKPQGSGFDQSCDRTQTLLKSFGRMMQPQAFDMFAFSWSQRVVENQKAILPSLDYRLTEALKFLLKLGDDLRDIFQKMMKAVGIASAKVSGDFPNRAELHKPDQTCEIHQKMPASGLRQNLQELAEIGRNLFWASFAHGFRALLALVGIGDFGRKPFCLKGLSLSVT